jgi:hypothetical protein
MEQKGRANSWIKSYPVDRYQRAEIKNTDLNHQITSKWHKIRHDVPQESMLGPLVFLPYIND